MSKHHTSWGGLSVRHLCLDDSVLEPGRYCDRTTGNSKLHRAAQSNDSLDAKKIIDGKDVHDIWNLVSKTSTVGLANIEVKQLQNSPTLHWSVRMS